MTRQVGYNAKCPKCGTEVPIMTPFSNWLRRLPDDLSSKNFSLHNLDFIWHQYRENWLITMEEKRYGGQQSDSQADTQGIIKQMLEASSGMKVQTLRGMKVVEYRGHYLVVFDQTNPDDSETIMVNGMPVSFRDLELLLRSGRI